jgi:hypothetical protein
VNAWKRAAYRLNPEKIKEQAAKWRAQNPERAQEARHDWEARNAEHLKSYARKFRRTRAADIHAQEAMNAIPSIMAMIKELTNQEQTE